MVKHIIVDGCIIEEVNPLDLFYQYCVDRQLSKSFLRQLHIMIDQYEVKTNP